MIFQGFCVTEEGREKGSVKSLECPDLSLGEVLIRAHYSSLNYKDALAITGEGKILRRLPLIPGIDVAGVVYRSRHEGFQEGEEVLVTGCGLGETQDGGYAEYVKVPASWLIKVPEGLSLREAMIYGTAGFTAGLCIHRLLQNQQRPDMGPMLVTGASGGVGSLATAMLSDLGFQVCAVSSKRDHHEVLRQYGASEVLHPDQLHLGQRPLESVRFGGAIDNVGGDLLGAMLKHIQLWGNVAVVGLAAGHEFQSSVMPLILRGVSLLGISSTNCPFALRQALWQQLSAAWRPKRLADFVSREITLGELPEAARAMLDRRTVGRILLRLS